MRVGLAITALGASCACWGVSPLLLARVLKIFHFMPSNFQTHNLP